ncbi:MAG: DUF4870 domain-containing protein [Candidatus Altiarchaeota archaeon]|nr:DUF4870 domain-containing protein [Candidatus Altiarchaeota archaeon]
MTEKKSDDNIMGAIAYLLGWLTGLIMYVMYKEKSKFVTFHGLQSIILSVVEFVVFFVLAIFIWIVGMILGAVSFGIGFIVVPIGMLLILVLYLAVTVFLMYKAYMGEKYKLPVIGEYAEKYV